MPHPSHRWWKVKAEIVAVWGTLSACASELKCSPESLRQSVDGKCPGIQRRLHAALAKRKGALA